MQTEIMQKTELTGQEIFDEVVRHSGQMTRHSMTSENDDGWCAYRGKGDNACFIGALVSDDEAKKMDISSVEGDSSITALPELLVPERLRPHRELLGALQPIHDIHPRSSWPDVLANVGDLFKLDISVITKVYPKGAEDFL